MIAFVVAGIGLLFSAPWWWTVTLGTAVYSLLLSILGLPVANFSILIDMAIVAILLIGNRFAYTILPFPSMQ